MSGKLKPTTPRRFSTLGASKKRKERDGFDAPEIPKIPKLVTLPRAAYQKSPEPTSLNRLLAGHLAHEFLSKGTLFGEAWPPGSRAQSEMVPAAGSGGAEPKQEAYKRYVTIADLLKGDGTHIPSIINPTQLGRYLRM